ncbi:hypothetical protein KSS87_015729 [Heliosperma pusillum]|nr:hypothetical protein KSS87_016404 [Heliosperma pusillum]KAH9619311.1 hypothetical protein KSS87_015729 [Heliosperma pusillum]
MKTEVRRRRRWPEVRLLSKGGEKKEGAAAVTGAVGVVRMVVVVAVTGDGGRREGTGWRFRSFSTLLYQFWFDLRMSPSGIYQFINNPTNKPSDNQILAIKQMGFEGLLHLQTDTVPGNLTYWLVSTFDPYKGCLLDGTLPILEEDIHACMGIPMGPLVVDEAPIGDKSPQFLSLLEDFKSQYEGDLIDVKVILRKLSTQIDGGDSFKRNFIVYIFSSFLGGVKGNKASLRILKSLYDTSLISEYNWCNFIKKNLAEQVLSWQKEGFSEEKTVKENWFGGPIMVLVFIYLDSSFGHGSVEGGIVINHKPLPKIELVQSSKPTIVSEQHPMPKKVIPSVLEEEDKDDRDRNNVPTSSQVNNVFVDKLVSKANNLAKAFVEYKSVSSEALNKLPSSEVVCKMVAAVDENVLRDVQENENVDNVKGKDNVEDHVVDTDKVVEKVLRDLQDNENFDNVRGKDNVESFWGSSWGWSEAQLLDALNAVGDAMQPIVAERVKVSQRTKVDTIIRKLKKPRSPPDCPSFRLLSSSDDDSQPTDNTDHIPPQQEHLPPEQPHLSSVVANTTSSLDPDAQPDSQPTHNTDNMPPEEEHVPPEQPDSHLSHVVANTTSPVILLTPSPLLENTNINPSLVVHHPNVIVIPDTPLAHKPSISRQAVYTRRRSPHLAKLDEVTDVPCSTPATVHVPFPLFPVDVHGDTDFDIPDNDNEIPENVRGKRVAFAAEVFRSPYLQRNISLLGDLNQAEKKILDFILGDSYDESEVLFKSQSSTLTRSELKTVIEGDRVSSHVIHVWCEILNNNERLRSRDSPCRLFVSFPKDINLDNVDVSGASLIFTQITVCSCPPFLFCFNLGNSKLQIIHPMKDTAVTYADYIQPTKDLLISLLERKLPVVTSVSWMMPEVFIPKSSLNCDQIDNGLHLLRILETFKGSKNGYSIGLMNETQLTLYALRVCHRIITCNENILRKKVQQDAEKWSSVPRGYQLLPYTDNELVKFVWERRAKKDLDVAMVSTEWMEVTRIALQSLRPRAFLMDQVIDMFGIKSTVGRTYLLYLPTTTYTVDLEKKPSIWGNYVKCTYIPVDGRCIEKVFIHIIKDKHWWACVCDLKRKKCYILDSCMSLLSDPENEYTMEIVRFLFQHNVFSV